MTKELKAETERLFLKGEIDVLRASVIDMTATLAKIARGRNGLALHGGTALRLARDCLDNLGIGYPR